MNFFTTDQFHADRPTVRDVPGPIVGFESPPAREPPIAVLGADNDPLPLPSRAQRTRRVPRREDDGIGALHPGPHLRPWKPSRPSDPYTTNGSTTSTPTDRGAA
jgi:hypothetical protein